MAELIGGAADALDAASALEGAGLVVEKGADLSTEAMRSLARGYYAQTQRQGRSVILLSGQFVSHGAETWLLGTEANAPGLPDAIVLLGIEEEEPSLGHGRPASTISAIRCRWPRPPRAQSRGPAPHPLHVPR
ncbi:MAG: hypothetical protein KAX74_00540, partial [Sphaerotilus sp.]|nr:hypothetical protein [Sphaerotilus sp.]